VEGTGINYRKGILVDERMCTSVQDIYAAGDVAEAKSFFSGDRMVNPIQPSAQEQGMVAGFNMAGKTSVYAGAISMNALKFFGNSAFTIGSLEGKEGKESVVYTDEDKGCYRRLVFEGDRIIGGIFVNDEVEPGIVLDLIKRKAKIGSLKDEIISPGATCESWYKCLFQEWVSAG
jgi:phenylglyoxylate dehydrogenase epsilon subunit